MIVESTGYVVSDMRMGRGWMVVFVKLLSTPTGTCLNKPNKVDGEEGRGRIKVFACKAAREQE